MSSASQILWFVALVTLNPLVSQGASTAILNKMSSSSFFTVSPMPGSSSMPVDFMMPSATSSSSSPSVLSPVLSSVTESTIVVIVPTSEVSGGASLPTVSPLVVTFLTSSSMAALTTVLSSTETVAPLSPDFVTTSSSVAPPSLSTSIALPSMPPATTSSAVVAPLFSPVVPTSSPVEASSSASTTTSASVAPSFSSVVPSPSSIAPSPSSVAPSPSPAASTPTSIASSMSSTTQPTTSSTVTSSQPLVTTLPETTSPPVVQFFPLTPVIVAGIMGLLILVLSSILQLVLCYFSSSRGFDFIHLNIVVSLVCGVFFLTVGTARDVRDETDPLLVTCKVFSGLSTYFLLVPLVWVMGESVYLNYFYGGEIRFHIIMMALLFGFCWLFPALIVLITGVAAGETTIARTGGIATCWLSAVGATYMAFFTPVIIIAVLSAVFVGILLLRVFWLRKKKQLSSEEAAQEKEALPHVWFGIIAMVAVGPLLVFSWIFVMAYYNEPTNAALGWLYFIIFVPTCVVIFLVFVVYPGYPLLRKKLSKKDDVEKMTAGETSGSAPSENTFTFRPGEGKNREGIELKENNTSTDKPAEGSNEKSNESDMNHQTDETNGQVESAAQLVSAGDNVTEETPSSDHESGTDKAPEKANNVSESTDPTKTPEDVPKESKTEEGTAEDLSATPKNDSESSSPPTAEPDASGDPPKAES